jgi:hypothetical protein
MRTLCLILTVLAFACMFAAASDGAVTVTKVRAHAIVTPAPCGPAGCAVPTLPPPPQACAPAACAPAGTGERVVHRRAPLRSVGRFIFRGRHH